MLQCHRLVALAPLAALAFAHLTPASHAQCIVGQWYGEPPTGRLALGANLAADGDWLATTSLIGSDRVVHILRKQADGQFAWHQDLVAPEAGVGFAFGRSLDLDQSTLAVGSPVGSPSPLTAGRVYVYELNGDLWQWSETLHAPEGADSEGFGFGVDLGTSGLAAPASSTAVNLPPGGPQAADNAGVVYLYRRESTGWSFDGELSAPTPLAGGRFGSSVGLTRTVGGVDQVLVGHPGDDTVSVDDGSVLIYERQGPTAWTLTQTIDAPIAWNFGEFGKGMAVDGNRAVVAAQRGGPLAQNTGYFERLERQGNVWSAVQTFDAGESLSNKDFTSALDLSGDNFAVGASNVNSLLPLQGAVFRFVMGPGGLQLAEKVQPKFEVSGHDFGQDVAWIPGPEPRLAIGANGDATFGSSHGAVFEYAWGPANCQTLFSNLGTASASGASSAPLRLEPSAGSAGLLYFVLGSISGTSPGLTVDGQHLPLVIDDYFLLTLLKPNTPPLTNSLGVVPPGWGVSFVDFTLQPGVDPALVGTLAHHAFLLFDPVTSAAVHASNAFPLVLVP